MKKMVLSLLFLVILLSGCSQKIEPRVEYIEKIVYKEKNIPFELLNCKDIVIDNNISTQADVARIIIELYDGYYDCKDKINSIKKINNLK
jgi:PBP1b-binding outer membrane lipoprotein LpoB